MSVVSLSLLALVACLADLDPDATDPVADESQAAPAAVEPAPDAPGPAGASDVDPAAIAAPVTAAIAPYVPPSGDADTADNSLCLVCHANFEDEELARTHAAAGTGCEDCHGSSDEHSSDEGNVTPPDVMFSSSSVVASCVECHDRAAMLAIDRKHSDYADASIAAEKTCAECHGKHRMAQRTVRWDPETREIVDSTVE